MKFSAIQSDNLIVCFTIVLVCVSFCMCLFVCFCLIKKNLICFGSLGNHLQRYSVTATQIPRTIVVLSSTQYQLYQCSQRTNVYISPVFSPFFFCSFIYLPSYLFISIFFYKGRRGGGGWGVVWLLFFPLNRVLACCENDTDRSRGAA